MPIIEPQSNPQKSPTSPVQTPGQSFGQSLAQSDRQSSQTNGPKVPTPSTELDLSPEINAPHVSVPTETDGPESATLESDDGMARSEQWSEGLARPQTLPPDANR